MSTFFTYFIRLLIFSHFKNKKRANVTVTCPFLYGFILIFWLLPIAARGAVGDLQELYARLLTEAEGLFVPDGGLNLTDVGTAHHQHTEA